MLLNGMDSNKMLVYLVQAGAEPSCFSSIIDKSKEKRPSSNLELKSSRGTYDIVAANILLNPLLELAEHIVGFVKNGGTVAVSGILCEQVQNRHGFRVQKFLTTCSIPLWHLLLINYRLY